MSTTPGIDNVTALHDPAQFETGVPHSRLAQLRQEHALVWVDEPDLGHWPAGPGYWLVLRHAEVGQVLKNPALFSSSSGGTQLRNPPSAKDLQFVQAMMLNMDPPQHTRLRRLLQNAFTSTAINKLSHRIEQHANHLVEHALANSQVNHKGERQCDFARDIASDMPLLALADILGMPAEDRYLMYDWANRVIGFQDSDYASSSEFDAEAGSAMARAAVALRPQPAANGHLPDPRTREGMPDLYHYAHLLGEHKRAHPGDDVMSKLMSQVTENNGQVSINEFENLFWLFAVAGNETVRNGLPGGMIALLENPSVWQQLREQPDMVGPAIDEMLRWWTPVMIFRRTATTDTRLAGQQLLAGDKVVVSFTSANRDESVFENADKFVPGRTHNPHYALGYGPHFCLGAQLAKAQMVAVFSALLQRVSHVQLAAPAIFLRSNFQRGVKSLPISWKP